MADEIKALAHTPVLMHTLVRAVRVKIKFSNQHEISRHPKVWIMPDKRQLNVGSSFSCLLFFLHFLNESPATSDVAATLFVCVAPGVFCGL